MYDMSDPWIYPQYRADRIDALNDYDWRTALRMGVVRL
jgi:hypothetical protein